MLVPDPGRHAKRVRRTFLDIMTPDWRSRPTADLPVTLGAGTSLADVGLIHIALLILKVPDGRMDYRDFGQLLRTPYLKAAETEASARASLDCWIRNRQQMELDLRGIKSHTESAAPVFFDLLREGLDFRRDTGGGLQDASRWAEAFASLLT